MDQGEFAAFLGVGPSTYSRWENQRVQPSLLWALRISRILNLRLEDWLEEISD